jgi:hypothetical protein
VVVLDSVEEALDLVSVFVLVPIDEPWMLRVRAGRNNRFRARFFYCLRQAAAIVPFVSYRCPGFVLALSPG